MYTKLSRAMTYNIQISEWFEDYQIFEVGRMSYIMVQASLSCSGGSCTTTGSGTAGVCF